MADLRTLDSVTSFQGPLPILPRLLLFQLTMIVVVVVMVMSALMKEEEEEERFGLSAYCGLVLAPHFTQTLRFQHFQGFEIGGLPRGPRFCPRREQGVPQGHPEGCQGPIPRASD